jgi:hypothetical protein
MQIPDRAGYNWRQARAQGWEQISGGMEADERRTALSSGAAVPHLKADLSRLKERKP